MAKKRCDFNESAYTTSNLTVYHLSKYVMKVSGPWAFNTV